MKKLFLMSFLALLSLCTSAYDFEAGGIYYNITGDNTVEVTSGDDYNYKGDIAIPNSISHDSKEYSVTGIGYRAFYWCKDLSSIDISTNVISVGEEAFYYTSLTSINIPANVTSIGKAALGACYELTSIIVAKENRVYDSRNDCNAIIETNSNTLVHGCKNTVIPSSVTSIGDYAFASCYGLTSINIPSNITGIGEWAFHGCGLKSINIPSNVTTIGNRAFSMCSDLTSINIPSSVTSIGEGAVTGCSNLTSIIIAKENSIYDSRNGCNAIIETSSNTLVYGCKSTVIPASVTSIGSDAFFDCENLTSINIPEGVKTIGDRAFNGCRNLKSVSIPESVTSIGLGAFLLCESLTYINIPEGVTSIGTSAFYGCSGLTSINIPKSMTKIEDCVFQGCSNLTSIDIPESVTSIGQGAFGGCVGLTSINIPENVTSIGWNAFGGCIGLTIIIIPKSVTSIGGDVVVGCASLRDIYCMGYTPADVSNLGGWNNDIEENCTLHVPYGTIDRYKTADGWKEFANIVEFDPTGIEAVSADRKSAMERRIYNLGGARMTAPQRGLNIINGKKVVY